MTYTLSMSPADEALIKRHAARENLSVPDFMLRATKKLIEGYAHVPRPKARDKMTDEEFDAMLECGYQQSLTQEGTPAEKVFARLYKELELETV